MQNNKILLFIAVVLIIAAAGWVTLSGKVGSTDFSGEDVTYIDTENQNEETAEETTEDEDLEDALNSLSTDLSHEISYEHVMPGVYSEIYLTVTGGTPGQKVERVLEGPGVESVAKQSATYDAEGNARFTWRINTFGAYVVSTPKVENGLIELDGESVARITVR